MKPDKQKIQNNLLVLLDEEADWNDSSSLARRYLDRYRRKLSPSQIAWHLRWLCDERRCIGKKGSNRQALWKRQPVESILPDIRDEDGTIVCGGEPFRRMRQELKVGDWVEPIAHDYRRLAHRPFQIIEMGLVGVYLDCSTEGMDRVYCLKRDLERCDPPKKKRNKQVQTGAVLPQKYTQLTLV